MDVYKITQVTKNRGFYCIIDNKRRAVLTDIRYVDIYPKGYVFEIYAYNPVSKMKFIYHRLHTPSMLLKDDKALGLEFENPELLEEYSLGGCEKHKITPEDEKELLRYGILLTKNRY